MSFSAWRLHVWFGDFEQIPNVESDELPVVGIQISLFIIPSGIGHIHLCPLCARGGGGGEGERERESTTSNRRRGDNQVSVTRETTRKCLYLQVIDHSLQVASLHFAHQLHDCCCVYLAMSVMKDLWVYIAE